MGLNRIKDQLKGWVPAPSGVKFEDYVGADADRNEATVREGFLAKARKFLRYLPMAQEAVAMYFCMLDARTPLWVKGTVAGALAYFILPLDAIPDIIPIAGLGDDASVLAATLAAVSSHVTLEHRSKARDWMEQEDLGTAEPAPGPG